MTKSVAACSSAIVGLVRAFHAAVSWGLTLRAGTRVAGRRPNRARRSTLRSRQPRGVAHRRHIAARPVCSAIARDSGEPRAPSRGIVRQPWISLTTESAELARKSRCQPLVMRVSWGCRRIAVAAGIDAFLTRLVPHLQRGVLAHKLPLPQRRAAARGHSRSGTSLQGCTETRMSWRVLRRRAQQRTNLRRVGIRVNPSHRPAPLRFRVPRRRDLARQTGPTPTHCGLSVERFCARQSPKRSGSATSAIFKLCTSTTSLPCSSRRAT